MVFSLPCRALSVRGAWLSFYTHGGVAGVQTSVTGAREGGALLSEWCFVLSPVDQTVSAQVELTVTVTNQVYHDELQNRSSEEFKKFNETFSEQVNLGQHNPRATQLPPGRTLEGLRKLKAIPLLEGCEVFSPSPQILRACHSLGDTGAGVARVALVSRKDLSIWPVYQ
jgi:hypothetical protein